MGFYEQISKYYDYIFPAGKAQVEFIKESAGLPPKRVLDVACGSGGYSVELAKAGYMVTAVDLDYKMIEMTGKKAMAAGVPINAFQCDMKELAGKSADRGLAGYDCIYCIGNSLVHLGSIPEIEQVLRQMHMLLTPSGALVIQIINFDRIIKYKIDELPAIKNEEAGIEFIRKYEDDQNSGKIYFNTILSIGGEERYENSIELLPVLSGEMVKSLNETGFRDLELYGDFNCAPYNEDSYMLVIKAKK